MQNASTLKFAGDVEFKELQIISLNGQSVNILNQVVNIEIYEDVFSPFMSMSIVLKESVDFLNLLPFSGEEYVSVSIDTPTVNKPIKNSFYIYKITDRAYTGEKEIIYTLKCISIEFLNDVNTKISKAYSGNVSESALKVLTTDGLNTKKKYTIDQSTNTTKFVSNFWSPVKCLNYLASNAVSKTNSPSFLFYENRDGFNFRAINDLLKANVYHKFIKDNYTRSTRNNITSVNNVNEDYKRIIELNVPVLTDYISGIQNGQLKSRLITHDILTKKYTYKDYSVKKDTSPFNLLNENPAYSKYAIANAASALTVQPKHYGMFSNYIDATNTKILQRRISFFKNLEKYKINLTVYGRTDYTIGEIIELDVPIVAQITDTDKSTKDRMLSGKYFVSAISHTINKSGHTCNMEIIKNSLLTNLSKQ